MCQKDLTGTDEEDVSGFYGIKDYGVSGLGAHVCTCVFDPSSLV